MKTLIKFYKGFITRKPVILLLLLILITSMGSCSSDDEPDVVENTFLKRFAGEKWEDLAQSTIFKFNDDVLNPLVMWQSRDDDECFQFFKVYRDDFEILNQTNDTFKINFRIIYDDNNPITEDYYGDYSLSFFVNEKGNIQIGNNSLTKTDKTVLMCDN